MTLKASIALAVLGLVAGVGCSSGSDRPAVTTPGVVESTTSTVAADPYDVYLKNNPEPGLVISREDAQTRALLGCGTQWAPGTVDAVLHDAYKELCKS